jgi:DNA-binding transcriptional regulator YiaG
MNKQQFKQARKTLNLSCDKFAQELGLKGKHRDRWIRRLEDTRPEAEKFKPSQRLIKNAGALLKIHKMKVNLIKE